MTKLYVARPKLLPQNYSRKRLKEFPVTTFLGSKFIQNLLLQKASLSFRQFNRFIQKISNMNFSKLLMVILPPFFGASEAEIFTSIEEFDPFVEYISTNVVPEAVEQILEDHSSEQE